MLVAEEPLYADECSVVKALRRELTDAEREIVFDLIEEASDLVTAFLGVEVLEPFPRPVVTVTSRAVARTLERIANEMAGGLPDHVTQVAETRGPYTRSLTFRNEGSAHAPWLTKQDKRLLSRLPGYGSWWGEVPLVSDLNGRYGPSDHYDMIEWN